MTERDMMVKICCGKTCYECPLGQIKCFRVAAGTANSDELSVVSQAYYKLYGAEIEIAAEDVMEVFHD